MCAKPAENDPMRVMNVDNDAVGTMCAAPAGIVYVGGDGEINSMGVMNVDNGIAGTMCAAGAGIVSVGGDADKQCLVRGHGVALFNGDFGYPLGVRAAAKRYLLQALQMTVNTDNTLASEHRCRLMQQNALMLTEALLDGNVHAALETIANKQATERRQNVPGAVKPRTVVKTLTEPLNTIAENRAAEGKEQDDGNSGPRRNYNSDGKSDAEKDWESVLRLCDLWKNVSIDFRYSESYGEFTYSDEATNVAACVVSAFARAGMTFEGVGLSRLALLNSRLALAILALPAGFGVDVNAKDGYGDYICPVIGSFNGSENGSLLLFERLLHRTDRYLLNAGLVFVERSCEYYNHSGVHILISMIMQCACGMYVDNERNLMDRLRIFIEHAHADGDGTDLTGGVAVRRLEAPTSVSTDCFCFQFMPPEKMCPDGKFRGAAVLADTLYRHCISHQEDLLFANARERLALARNRIITALGRIRFYRQALRPSVSRAMISGGLGMHDLHKVVLAYLLVPLHNESHLADPLLGGADESQPSTADTQTDVYAADCIKRLGMFWPGN
jgi:hypothetical protein